MMQSGIDDILLSSVVQMQESGPDRVSTSSSLLLNFLLNFSCSIVMPLIMGYLDMGCKQTSCSDWVYIGLKSHLTMLFCLFN
ncbi:hypothetical protein FKM82_025859 [Ascaphus truei]